VGTTDCTGKSKIKSRERRKEIQIKKTETETNDKLIKKGQPIAQSPPERNTCIQGIPEPTSFHPLVSEFWVVSLSLSERVDERRGMVSHIHEDGYRGAKDKSVGARKYGWRQRHATSSRRLDGAVDVHLLLNFRAKDYIAFDRLAFFVSSSSFGHLKLGFDITVHWVGGVWPIAASGTPCSGCTLRA